jgi:hypothetical protein
MNTVRKLILGGDKIARSLVFTRGIHAKSPPFEGLGHCSRYGEGDFPEPFLVDDSGL